MLFIIFIKIPVQQMYLMMYLLNGAQQIIMGTLKANYYFQDNIWHCWNETGDNVTCVQ